MRVEIVCASRELFGADRSAVRLGVLIASLGAEVWLTVPAQRPELGLGELAERHGLSAIPGPVVVASSRGVSGLTARRNPGRSESDLTIYNSAAITLRRGDRRPRALVLREWLVPRRIDHRALIGLHRRRVDRVVAVSKLVAERWRAGSGPRPPVEIIPNWLDEAWLSSDRTPDREGVLFVGRLNSWKGQLLLADAYEWAFARQRSRPSLTFLGAEDANSRFGGNADELRRRCRRLGAELLDVTGDPRPLISRAALVVVPSLRPEPFGNVILEALACGAKVIAFPGGGANDLAPQFGEALEVVDRGLESLAAALGRWWTAGGEAQRSQLHGATLATLRRHYTAAAIAPQWQSVLTDLA